MAAKKKAAKKKTVAKRASVSTNTNASIEAPILDTVRVAASVRDELVHPDPAPLHEVPKDADAEAMLVTKPASRSACGAWPARGPSTRSTRRQPEAPRRSSGR